MMVDKNYQYQISTEHSYTINDLVTAWESGWQHLKRFAELQSTYKPKVLDESHHYLSRLLLVIDDILYRHLDVGKQFDAPNPCPKYIELLNLAASDENNPYAPVIKTIYVKPQIVSLFGVSKGVPKSTYPERLGDWSEDKRKLKKAIKKLADAFTKSNTVGSLLSNITDNRNLKLFKEYWSKPNFEPTILNRQLWAEKKY